MIGCVRSSSRVLLTDRLFEPRPEALLRAQCRGNVRGFHERAMSLTKVDLDGTIRLHNGAMPAKGLGCKPPHVDR